MSWEETVLAEIDRTADELIELAGDLIRIPSENPPGDCTEIGEFIAAVLRKAGVEVDVLDAGQGRLNVVSHQGPEGDRHLVLAGHTDVVPVGDVSRWSFPPFAGDVVDGYLRGRGASDMKAGLAGVIHAYVVMHRLGVPLAGRLSLAAVPDEEAGGPLGADWLRSRGCGRWSRMRPATFVS